MAFNLRFGIFEILDNFNYKLKKTIFFQIMGCLEIPKK